MKEIFVRGTSLPESYHKAILALHTEGDVLSCDDWNQRQKEISMTFVVDEPLREPMVSRLYIGGYRELQQYIMEVLDGILNFKIGQGNCWPYTYNDRLVNYQKKFNQIEFIVSELKRSPDTRRAVAVIRDNDIDPFNNDAACLQNIQYFIREGKLQCKVLMRSNDAVEAAFMNAFAFIFLQKSIADRVGVEIGGYTHRANSFHAYSKDFKLLEQYADGILKKPIEDITYAYQGFYDELMKESIPEILEMVNGLPREE